MQGVCDSNCSFIMVTARHVGSTGDAIAFDTTTLRDFNSRLPLPYHWNGDNAYTSSETMMIPYPGTNLHTLFPDKDTFNSYHSQLRICIERCFGMFVQRWGIFWSPLGYDLEVVVQIIEACCRLHNMCIRENVPVVVTNVNQLVAVDENGALLNDEWRMSRGEGGIGNVGTIGNSLRQLLVEEILQRPDLRIIRSHHQQ